MVYFFLNVVMYLVMILFLIKYFNKMNIVSFIIVLFNMNVFFIFILKDINFIYGLMVICISIIMYSFINLFHQENKEFILIQKGNINFQDLIKSNSYFKMLNYLKKHHIKIDEVEYCLIKNNDIIVIRNKDIQSYPVSVILDGKLQYENLKLIHKDEEWLRDELLKNNLLVSMVNYAFYKNNQIYFVKI